MDETKGKMVMKTFQTEVNLPADRRLLIELPEDVAAGSYQVVVVLNPTKATEASRKPSHHLNDLAGQVQSFAKIDAVAWQRQVREECI